MFKEQDEIILNNNSNEFQKQKLIYIGLFRK